MILRVISLLVACVSLVHGEDDFPTDNGVYVLTDENFDKFMEKHKVSGSLIEFYAPWCGHCKALAPEYETAAEELERFRGEDNPVAPLAKVDCTENEAIAKKYDIKGYPTVKWFGADGAEPTDYDGERDKDGIVSFVRQRSDKLYKPPPESVRTLVTEDFEDFVVNHDLSLVEFYAPWCGHCKAIAPKYEKAAQQLLNEDPPIPLAKVDATVEKELGQKYGVSGYPTLKVFRRGKAFDYKGPRETKGIVSYMREQAAPAADLIKSLDDLRRSIPKDDVMVIGLFQNHQAPMLDVFNEAAEQLRGEYKLIAYSFDRDVMIHFHARPNSIIVAQPERFWSKYEDKYKVFETNDASAEDIAKWVRENHLPLMGHRAKGVWAKRYDPIRPLCVVFYDVSFDVESEKATQYWRERLLPIAKKYSPTFKFAIANEDDFMEELKSVGLSESGQDVNVLCLGADDRKYPRHPDEDDFTAEEFDAFMKKMKEGRVPAHSKSQPIPKKNDGPVTIVVAKTFDRIVLDSSKDVLIEFYAPWCGHCKALEPKYAELGRKMKKTQPNLVIAKYDATANDVPADYVTEGFPTIYFAPMGRKDEPIKFTGGDRSVEALETFIKQHAVASFKKKEEL